MAITAVFSEGIKKAYTESVYQHDKRQVLEFVGIEIPTKGEVHFSNSSNYGISVAVKPVGSSVLIPDVMFETGEYVYAWVYARSITGGSNGEFKYHLDPDDPEQDHMVVDSIKGKSLPVETAQTLYEVVIPVIKRPNIYRIPDDPNKEQDIMSLFEDYEVDGEHMILKG